MHHALVVRRSRIAGLPCAVLWAVAALGPPASAAERPAAEAPPAADLARLIEEALAGSPALKAASARLEATRSLASQVAAPPDPEVSVAYVNDGVSSFTLGESEFATLSLTWTQEVPYPGKRKGAGDVALLESDRVSRELDRARLEIASSVTIAYADLYRLDAIRSILEETKGVLDSLAQATMRRYEVGQGIQENVLKSQTEILRVEAQLLGARQERRAAEARLNATVGRSEDVPVGAATLLPEAALAAAPDLLGEKAIAASPEIASLVAAVRRQEASLQLAQLQRKPDFLWSATYQNRGGLDPMVGAMFGVRLPVHKERKQSQALLQADWELQAARHELTDRQIRTRATVAELLSRAERAERLKTLYEQGVVPQARGALESALASYAVGRIALLDVLNDLRILLEARTELARQESDRVQALAALEPLVTMDLIRVPGSSGEGGSDDLSR